MSKTIHYTRSQQVYVIYNAEKYLSNCRKTFLLPNISLRSQNSISRQSITGSIKNKSGVATDKHNFRPIAISTTMSKVLELLMLHKIDSYLYTTDNQFGFKQNHGTDMCIYALRQNIDYYKRNASPVFICYLDASKDFDRVNHCCLFKNNSLIETSLSP